MFSTSRRHAHGQSKTPTTTTSLPISKNPPLSAPPTPSTAHLPQRTRPSTASAAPASFSRATGRLLSSQSPAPAARPLTAGAAAAAAPSPKTKPVHLPASVPLSFPTPSPSPSPSPSARTTTMTPLRLSMPHMHASVSACATPSPLSSGLPSPTLPPLPASHLSGQSQSTTRPITIASPAAARSPVINIGSGSGSPHHVAGKDAFDYALTRPTHARKYSGSTSSGSGTNSNAYASPGFPSDPSSPSSVRSGSAGSVREDMLAPGDRVGAGLSLQGEVLRRVFSSAETEEDCKEEERGEEGEEVQLEVVRRLGAGSYAVVYLVREVMSRSADADADSDSEDNHTSTEGQYGDRVDDLGFWDSSEMDMDADAEFDGMWRKKMMSVSEEEKKVEYGKEYAVKVLSKAGMDEEALEAQLVEASIHQSLPTHPNIVTLHRALETPSFLLLVLEFVPGEDLYYFLEQARDHFEPGGHKANTSVLSVETVETAGTLGTTRTPPTPSLLSTLNEKQLLGRRRLRLIASMFAQMCEAVAVCHDVGVYHRDIKPENFIVTDGWEEEGERRVVIVKLTDFGLSTREAASSDMDCGSAPYMSFECRNNCAPTYAPRAADVWSLGIVLINMLYHINPWTDTTQGVCPSFSAFLAAPELFFMQRFAGMVPAVASFLCRRVFCVLPSDDPADNAGRRVDARTLGRWARELPRLMSSEEPVGVPPAVSSLEFPPAAERAQEEEKDEVPTSPSSALLVQSLAAVLAQQEAAAAAGSSSPAWRHRRGLSNASVGYALSSVPQSRRPASRNQSFSAERAPHLGLSGVGVGVGVGMGSAAGSCAATPLLRGRALGSAGPRSRAPSSCEVPPMVGVSELPTVFDEGEGDVSGGSLGLELGVGEVGEERDAFRGFVMEEPEMEHEQEHENENEQDGEDEESMSRSTSMVRRRKRGARRGKGQIIQQQQAEIARLQQQQNELARQVQQMQQQLHAQQGPSVSQQTQQQQTGPNDTLDSLASASEALARELSRTRNPRGPPTALVHAHSYSHLPPTAGAASHSHSLPHPLPHSHSHSHSSASHSQAPASSNGPHALSSVSAAAPVPMHAISGAGMGASSPARVASPSAVMAFSGSGGPTPGAMFPVSFAASGRTSSAGSVGRRSQATASSSSGRASVVEASAPMGAPSAPAAAAPPAIVKKASKWKLIIGKGSSTAVQNRPPLPAQTQAQAQGVIDITDADGVVESAQSGAYLPSTARSVANVLMSLEADVSVSGSLEQPQMAGSNETWSRGRRPPGGPPQQQQQQQQTWSPATLSTDRWANTERERNVSPNSTRTGRSGNLSTLSSSASSVSHSSVSSNWRHSTLTTSSATSGFTRYSNGSVRSVSTVATSVSGGSGNWRQGNASNASLASAERKPSHYSGGGPPSIASRNSERSTMSGSLPPPNVKIMTGVPWALDELPRQLQPNNSGDIFGMPPAAPRKQRTRKPKDLPTINERPSYAMSSKAPPTKSPLSQRLDAGRSSTSLHRHSSEGEDGEERADGTPRKVQKGQINALAKMLSALRR